MQRVGKVVIDGNVDPVAYATQKPSTVRRRHGRYPLVTSLIWTNSNKLWSEQLLSADTVYKGLITGCALAGPAGCPVASPGDGPLDIGAKLQVFLKAARDATKANASVPLPLGVIRRAYAS